MAQFFGEIQGGRGTASRLGHKSTGLWGHLRGWSVGCKVRCFYDETTDTDMVKVYATKGSGGNGQETLIATIYESGEVQFAEALQQGFGITLHKPEPVRT